MMTYRRPNLQIVSIEIFVLDGTDTDTPTVSHSGRMPCRMDRQFAASSLLTLPLSNMLHPINCVAQTPAHYDLSDDDVVSDIIHKEKALIESEWPLQSN